MAVINDYCIVLNNKLEPSDRWHNLAVMSVSFMYLISALWISASLLPCPWEIVLCQRKSVKGSGGQFLWECEESNQSVALEDIDFFVVSCFLNMQDKSSWIIHKLDPLLLRFSFWWKYSLLGGICWQYQWWVFPFVCQDAPNTHSREKAFRSFPHHCPIHHFLSRLLFFLPLTEGSSSLIRSPISSHFSFHCLGSYDTRSKQKQKTKPQQTLYSLPCSHLWSVIPVCVLCICTLAELGREGWGTTKHIRPNYSASRRAFLSCLGYLLLTVWVVWQRVLTSKPLQSTV